MHTQVFSIRLNSTLLAILAGGVMSLPFLNFDYSILAWVGMVPLLFAINKKSVVKSFGLGFISGLVLFACGKYWLVEFIELSKGLYGWQGWLLASLYWLYCAFLIALVSAVYRWLTIHVRLSPILLLPVVYTVVSSLYPMIFHLRLSETQVLNLLTIQGVDLLGPAGLDALIVAVNAVIFLLLNDAFKKGVYQISQLTTVLIIVCLLAGWFGYGVYRLASVENLISDSESVRIGLVQPNEIPSLNASAGNSGFSLSYPAEMALTEQLAANGADYVVWPEGRRKYYLDNPRVKNAYASQIRALNVGLIFQDTESIREPKSGKVVNQFNSALMLHGASDIHQRYDKVKLIPFRETIPLVSESKSLRPLAEGFIGRFLNELDKGEGYAYFQHRNLNFVPLICYETTFPEFVASRVENVIENDKESGGNTIMIGLSNDGWFGSNHQPYQHIYGSILRAVENRVPLVHAANNGPSLVVSASGEVLFSSKNNEKGAYLVEFKAGDEAISTGFRALPYGLVYACYIVISCLILVILVGNYQRVAKRTD